MGIERHLTAHEGDRVHVVTRNRNEAVLQRHVFLALAEIDAEMQVLLAPPGRNARSPGRAERFSHADSLADFERWHLLEVRVRGVDPHREPSVLGRVLKDGFNTAKASGLGYLAITTPSAIARIGVSSGAGMSAPSCQTPLMGPRHGSPKMWSISGQRAFFG